MLINLMNNLMNKQIIITLMIFKMNRQIILLVIRNQIQEQPTREEQEMEVSILIQIKHSYQIIDDRLIQE